MYERVTCLFRSAVDLEYSIYTSSRHSRQHLGPVLKPSLPGDKGPNQDKEVPAVYYRYINWTLDYSKHGAEKIINQTVRMFYTDVVS